MAKQIATLPVETLNNVLQFLASQPYAQVADMINTIQKEVVVTESDAGDETVAE